MMRQLQLPLFANKKIDTVKGDLFVHDIKRMLIHEHIFCRTQKKYLPNIEEYLDQQFEDLLKSGINTIVDVTTYVSPDMLIPFLVKKNMNIIVCTGFYVKKRVPSTYHDAQVDKLKDKLIRDIEQGIGRYRVRPGVMKVASQGRTLTSFEKRVMIAAAQTQQVYKNLPIITHAFRGGRKQVELLTQNGADPAKIVISHMEMELKGSNPSTFDELLADMKWVLDTGANLFFGDFSVSNSHYREQVIRLVNLFKSSGYLNQILLSTDSYWSWRSKGINIRGSTKSARIPRDYNYVNRLTIPLLSKNGFRECDFDQMLHHNLIRIFS